MAQFHIPREEKDADGELNYKDVEAGDVVYLQTGSRNRLLIRNFHGTKENPIIFRPSDWASDVIISSEENYGISIRNCSHISITGWQGANGLYGIKIEKVEGSGSVGVSTSNKSTNVELSFIEIGNVGFAGILSKTEPDCNDPSTFRGAFVQKDTRIHHCYIHDTGSEGLYIGSTQFLGQELGDCGKQYPHLLDGVRIHHNRVERTGWDGIQVSSALTDCKIYDNVLVDCSISEKEAQMSGIIIGGGTTADCYNNTIIDCRATAILVFGNAGTKVFNNLIIRPALQFEPGNPDEREYGIYINDKTYVDDSFYGIYSNTIIQPKSDGIRISSSFSFETRMYNNLIVDPGAWDVYENDNTDFTGNDSFVFLENSEQNVRMAANVFVRSSSLPKFMDAEDDNYRLMYDSQYVDAGRDLTDQIGVNFDIENKRRPIHDGWDVGAYEYGDVSASNLVSGSMEPVKIRAIESSDHDKELIITVFEPGFMKWTLLTITGQITSKSENKWYEQGEYHFSLKNHSSGIRILHVEGAGWKIAEKVLIN